MATAAATLHPVKMEVTVSSPEELSLLLAFCHQNHLPVISCAAAATPFQLSDKLQKPPAAFKELCGGPWLTPKGLISQKEAHAFLQNYVKANRLIGPDSLIQLDSALQSIFPEGTPPPAKLDPAHLPALVMSLFSGQP